MNVHLVNLTGSNAPCTFGTVVYFFPPGETTFETGASNVTYFGGSASLGTATKGQIILADTLVFTPQASDVAIWSAGFFAYVGWAMLAWAVRMVRAVAHGRAMGGM